MAPSSTQRCLSPCTGYTVENVDTRRGTCSGLKSGKRMRKLCNVIALPLVLLPPTKKARLLWGREAAANSSHPLSREPVPHTPATVLRVGAKTRLEADCERSEGLPGCQWDPALHLKHVADPSEEMEPEPHHVQDEEPTSEKKFGGHARHAFLIS